MIVDFVSVKIAKVKHENIPSTWSQPEKVRTTTTYDMTSAQEHTLNLDLRRPDVVFWRIRRTLVIEFIFGLLTFWVPLLLLSLIGGKALVSKMAWPAIILWLVVILIPVSWHQSKRIYASIQMEKYVKELRGTQDKYEIVLAKNWSMWRAKLLPPSILDR